MNIESVVSGCKVLNVEDKHSTDGKINWTEMVFIQGTNVNTVTIDPKIKKDLVIGEEYDFLFSVQEQIKASNNIAFKVHKFKCIGVFEAIK